jgi:subtilisin family serine protease
MAARQASPDATFSPLTAGVLMPAPGRKRVGGRSFHARFGEPVFSVFILGEACAEELLALGIVPRSAAGDIRTAFVPRSRLRALERCDGVRYVELARAWSCDLGQAIPLAQIDTLHAATPSVDGTGVIIGVIDNVLDIHHPDFRDANGATRVLFLWDQRLIPVSGEAGPPVAPALPGFIPQDGVTYGVEYSRARIDQELATVNPPAVPAYTTVRHAPPDPANGQAAFEAAWHGTKVTGCAAGNGLGSGAPGAAPGSEIIFVSPLGYDSGVMLNADNAGILDACAYIFARADQAGRPCVLNISLGDQQGPHDGTTMGERFLDSLLARPGRAITLSAGNATRLAGHAEDQLAPGGTKTLTLRVSAGTTGQSPPVNSDAIEIWYDGHDRIAVTLASPGPNPVVLGPVEPGTQPTGPDTVGSISVLIKSVVNDPRNGDNRISIMLIVPPGQSIPLGDWQLTLDARSVVNGRFNAWIDRNNWPSGPKLTWASSIQPARLTLGVPATATLPITVGSHRNNIGPLQLSNFSGRGPSRDGRIKPDLTAPGQDVVMPRPRNMYLVPPGPAAAAQDRGTSFAAPIVAGAAALLFQCRGASATAADIKQILMQTADTTGIAVPDNGFGFGALRMAAACGAAVPDVDVWLRDDPVDDGTEPFVRPVFWESPDIALLDTARNPVANPVHAPGARFSTIVQVTARNRGAQTARNVSVFLYWADPATNLPFPDAWRATSIFSGSQAQPPFALESNRIVLPQLAAGAAAVVEFAWAPPAPGSGLAGDGHFCLLARLEHELDPSAIDQGGFVRIPADNNLALRNVLVVAGGAQRGMRFHLRGSAATDSLMVLPELTGGSVLLRLPARLLHDRGPRASGAVHGAARIGFEGDVAVLRTDEARPLLVEGLRLADRALAPAAIEVRGRDASGAVHVLQLSAGARVGGVTLRLEEPPAKRGPAKV